MIRPTSAFALMFFTFIIHPALASSQCQSIQDADRFALCMARANQDAARCLRINDPDMRQLCQAQLNGGAHHCDAIRERAVRELCIAGQAGR